MPYKFKDFFYFKRDTPHDLRVFAAQFLMSPPPHTTTYNFCKQLSYPQVIPFLRLTPSFLFYKLNLAIRTNKSAYKSFPGVRPGRPL